MFNINNYLKEKNLDNNSVLYCRASGGFHSLTDFVADVLSTCVSVKNGNVVYADNTEDYINKVLNGYSVFQNDNNPTNKAKLEFAIKNASDDDGQVVINGHVVNASLEAVVKNLK